LCWVGAGVEPSSLLDPANLRAVAAFVRGLFPPDLSPEFLRVAAGATVRTLAISIAGTALSAILGLCLGILATASLWRRGPLLDGRAAGPLALLSLAARGVARFLRSVPDLVWALLFVVAFGLGPLPGTLALAVSYAGVLGRVYADLFEAVPEAPVVALHAAGASPLQTFVAAIWPQAAGSGATRCTAAASCRIRSSCARCGGDSASSGPWWRSWRSRMPDSGRSLLRTFWRMWRGLHRSSSRPTCPLRSLPRS